MRKIFWWKDNFLLALFPLKVRPFSTLQDWDLILIWKPQIKWNLFENGITYVTKLSLSCPKKKFSLEIFFTVSWTKAWRDEEVLSCILGGNLEHHITVLFISISASVPVFFSFHLTTNEKAIHFQKINVPHKKVNTAHLQSFRAVEWNVIVTRCLGSLLLLDVFEQPWKMVHFSWHPQSILRGVAQHHKTCTSS